MPRQVSGRRSKPTVSRFSKNFTKAVAAASLCQAGQPLMLMKVYELEQSPQNFSFYVHGRGHSVGHESRQLIYGFMDSHLKPPEVTRTRLIETVEQVTKFDAKSRPPSYDW